jgi:hypothetical protein
MTDALAAKVSHRVSVPQLAGFWATNVARNASFRKIAE